MLKTTIVLTIEWDKAQEEVRLPIEGLQSGWTRIPTRECWNGSGETVVYMPRVTYKLLDGAQHHITLDYREDDHKHLAKHKITWGECRIVISEKLKVQSVHWATKPKSHPTDAIAPYFEAKMARSVTPRSQTTTQRTIREQGFRSNLMKVVSCCEITGETTPECLEAAHIISVAEGGPDIMQNGLVLRADLHRLYDGNLIDFSADGKISFSLRLSPAYKELLKGKSLNANSVIRTAEYLVLKAR